jgi:hypothetical protein
MIDNLSSLSSIHLVKCSVKANSRNSRQVMRMLHKRCSLWRQILTVLVLVVTVDSLKMEGIAYLL